MIAVKNQSYATLLFAIFLFGSQLSRALNSNPLAYHEADVSVSAERGSFLQERMLDQISCFSSYCTGSLDGQSYLEKTITLTSRAVFTISIQIGKPKYGLLLSLSSIPTVQMETDISTFPGDLSDTQYDSNWSKSFAIDSSSFSSRTLKIMIQNKSYTTTISTFRLTVQSSEDKDSWSFTYTSNLGGVVGGAIGAVVVIAVIVGVCICIRRARLRRMAQRQRSRAAYNAQVVLENQSQPQAQQGQQPLQFPPQYQPQYQVQYQGQLQAPIMYQPINPNSPQSYQFQPAIQLVQVPGQDYQYYQGYQLAPPMQQMQPMQIVMPNPDEGPLSEVNFAHRFPEAPLENFASSFPQKTCSICLEDLKTGQNCRQLYCEHIFHGECAKVWLLNQMTKQNHGFCPNCNKNMTFVVERAKS